MKRLLAILVIVTVLGAFSTAAVSAQASGPPEADAWVDINAPTSVANTINLWIRGSTTACTVTNRTYMRWNLATIPEGITISDATLTLTANALSGDFTTPRGVTVYQVAGDAWDENTLIWNNAPAVGAAIATVNVTATGPVVFSGPALASYLDSQAKGDNLATLALQMTGDCTAGSSGVRFDSAETTTGAVPNLVMRSSPTAVNMSSASAQRAASWPLYAGLGAVALFVVVGVMISRRKMA